MGQPVGFQRFLHALWLVALRTHVTRRGSTDGQRGLAVLLDGMASFHSLLQEQLLPEGLLRREAGVYGSLEGEHGR